MEHLVVTSISPTYIANCIQFDNAEGQSQLLCILKGETSSFRISNETSQTSARKIRFVDAAFKTQLKGISKEAQEVQLHKLCALLVNELSEGRVIVEAKNRDGKVVAITSQSFTRHKKMEKYDTVECAGKKFFKEIATALETNLQTILTQTLKFNKEQNKAESHLEATIKQQDRHIIARNDSGWSLYSFFFGVVDSICSQFKPAISKIQGKILDKFIEDAREQARLSHEHQKEQRKKDKRIKAEELHREVLMQSIAKDEKNYEIRLQEQK